MIRMGYLQEGPGSEDLTSNVGNHDIVNFGSYRDRDDGCHIDHIERKSYLHDTMLISLFQIRTWPWASDSVTQASFFPQHQKYCRHRTAKFQVEEPTAF